jgi:hypothetical protein
MADIFGRRRVDPQKPITADMCVILWDGLVVTTATQVSVQYQQQVTRRRTLGGNGNPVAVIYPSQPIGSISIQRLVSEKTDGLFNQPGWTACGDPGTIVLDFNGATAYEGCTVTGGHYTATGCIVTSFNLAAEAEGLTVVDGVNIEFLQFDFANNA